MTARTLTPLAVSAAPILRALAAGGHATLSALATASGRDVRNMNRDLAALAEHGLITAPARDAAPTAAGFAALAALARAEGPDAPDGVWLTVDQLAPDPAQPRKRTGLGEADIEAMAASILERHGDGLPGLITPPTVRARPRGPATADAPDGEPPLGPEWLIVSGERRWRGWAAATRLLTWNRDPLPADTRFFCPVFRGDPAQAAVHAAVENLQRTDLDDLEWADHFAAMVAAAPALNGARIAALLGRPGPSGERWVQERLRVAARATPDARARFIESRRRATAGEDDPDPFTWTRLRDSVKVAAPATQPAQDPAPEPRSDRPEYAYLGLDLAAAGGDIAVEAVFEDGRLTTIRSARRAVEHVATGETCDAEDPDLPAFLRRLAGPGAPPPPGPASAPAAGPNPAAPAGDAAAGDAPSRPAPAPPRGDIVIQGTRWAMAALWSAARPALARLAGGRAKLAALIEAGGAHGDDLADMTAKLAALDGDIAALAAAIEAATPYVPAERRTPE